MPQFVIEREIPGAGSLSEAQIRELSFRSLETLHQMGPQIQWLHSYVTEDKVYCNEYWIALSILMADPAAHASFASVSLSDSQAPERSSFSLDCSA